MSCKIIDALADIHENIIVHKVNDKTTVYKNVPQEHADIYRKLSKYPHLFNQMIEYGEYLYQKELSLEPLPEPRPLKIIK